MLRAELF